MDEIESLATPSGSAKSHVAWIPKYGRKALYAELRRHLGSVLRELAQHRECTTVAAGIGVSSGSSRPGGFVLLGDSSRPQLSSCSTFPSWRVLARRRGSIGDRP